MSLAPYLLTGTQEALTEAFESDSLTNSELTAIIKADPLMSWHLYQFAKAQLKNKDTQIQSVNHILNLFGFGAIKQLILDKQPLDVTDKPSLKALTASYYCAHFATELLPEKHGTQGERFFLPTLVYCLLITERLHQQELDLTSHDLAKLLRMLHEQTPPNTTPRLTERTLALNLSRHCSCLAKIRKRAYEPDRVNKLLTKHSKDRQVFDDQPAGIYLLAQVMMAYYFDTTGQHKARFIALLSAHLRMLPDDLRLKLAVLSKKYARPTFDLGLAPHKQYKSNTANTGALHDPVFFSACMQQLETNDSFTKVQRIELARTAILRGIGASHCVFMVFNKTMELRTLGKGPIECSLKKTELGPLFEHLLKKGNTYRLKREHQVNAMSQLPSAWLSQWQPSPASFSAVISHKPLGIAYADKPEWNESDHTHFSQICKALNKALSR